MRVAVASAKGHSACSGVAHTGFGFFNAME